MLRGEAIRELGELASENSDMVNSHLNHITEDLLGYFPQPMPYPIWSAQCIVKWVNIEAFCSSVSLHD